MNASFGLDHPLIAVHDIDKLRGRLISLGFNMTAVGKHPWGTSTSLAMFEGCLLEIMGIYDDSLIDEVPAGDFQFGRHVYEHLQEREGVALTALHSTNSQADAGEAEVQGFSVSGHLEFGRDVRLPDGQQGRTKTTLALLPDKDFPRLSFFLCQQHRPELIYVPEWLQHANSVLQRKFCGLYGEQLPIDGGLAFKTANGVLRVQSRKAIEADLGALPSEIDAEQPSIVAMEFKYSDQLALEQYLEQSDWPYTQKQDVYTLHNPELSTCFGVGSARSLLTRLSLPAGSRWLAHRRALWRRPWLARHPRRSLRYL